MTDELVFAIFCGTLSVILLNIGLGTQKYGLSPSFFKKIAKSDRRKAIRSLVWLIGSAMTAVSVYLSFVVLAISRVSLMATLGGIGPIVLVLFSFFVLKEGINRIMLVGIVFLGVGTVIFGLFQEGTTEVNIDLSGLAVFTIAVIGYSLAIALYSVKRSHSYGGAVFGTVSGVLAGLGITLQKCSVAGGEVSLQLLTNIFFYGFAAASAASFLVTQFAFTKGTAITVVPSYIIPAIVLPQIGAMLVFAEYLELVQWLAIVLLVIGIVILTRFEVKPPKQPKPKKSSQNTKYLTKQRQGSKGNPPKSRRETTSL